MIDNDAYDCLDAAEKEHYKFCDKCNGFFDMRDVGQVLDHLDNPELLAVLFPGVRPDEGTLSHNA